MQVTTTQQTTPSSRTPTGTGANKLSADFNAFIKMLTAQVKNQDPLKPIDSTEFATQLATFSSLEQQVLTNSKLSEISSNLGGSNLSSLANIVGKRALVKGSFEIGKTSTFMKFDAVTKAENPQLIIRNDAGGIVFQTKVTAGMTEFSWNGLTNSGAAAKFGPFKAEIVDQTKNGTKSLGEVETYHKITEIRFENKKQTAIFSNVEKKPLSELTRIRS